MSRASATFYFDDGTKLHGIYNGTSDVMQRFLSSDAHEPWDWYYECGSWQGKDCYAEVERREEACTHEGEHVVVYSDYGSGEYWHGTACAECMIFKGPFDPYDDDVQTFRDLDSARSAPVRLNP